MRTCDYCGRSDAPTVGNCPGCGGPPRRAQPNALVDWVNRPLAPDAHLHGRVVCYGAGGGGASVYGCGGGGGGGGGEIMITYGDVRVRP